MPSIKFDLKNMVVEAEGSDEFVDKAITRFESLLAQNAIPQVENGGTSGSDASERRVKRATVTIPKRKPKRTNQLSKDNGAAVGAYRPSMNKQLDLSGLPAFAARYTTSKHAEKILVFCMFLRDELSRPSITADDIFTAYRFAHEKPAKAFIQSIRDACSKQGWVDYKSPTEIEITPLGETHFRHDLEKVEK
tara:strand:+ start:75997 stop:76572 length:576 start_codon:yes stop_codon:yes gene_type:complete